jgi:hypothetical protein
MWLNKHMEKPMGFDDQSMSKYVKHTGTTTGTIGNKLTNYPLVNKHSY